jgi:iron complex outermembrane receptor protein
VLDRGLLHHLAVAVGLLAGAMVCAAENPSVQPPDGAQNVNLDEIVVTAQKRSEKLLDVPDSISALSGQQLESMHVNSLSDLADYIPGLSIQDGGAPGARTIVLRGLSTGYAPQTGAPLVATYIDDAPVGPSNGLRGAQFGLDLMPYDLDRVEVLEGPQGTLYGSGAMGGIIKYVLRQPDLNNFEARVGADTESIDGSAGPSWNTRAAVNLPLIANELAVRISGTYDKSAGYINNVGAGVEDSNHGDQYGGRISVLWKPSEQFSMQGSFIVQDASVADRSGVTLDGTTLQPLYGRYSKFTNFLEPYDQQTLFGNLTIDWNLNFASLTSTTGWSKLTTAFVTDLPEFGVYTPGHPNALAYSQVQDRDLKYTEELRLTSPEVQRIQWMVGAFFDKEDPVEDYSLPTFTPQKVPLPYNLYRNTSPGSTFQEQAIFGNATYKFTEQFDLSAGLRYAENKETDCLFDSGYLNPPSLSACTSRPFQGVTTWMTDARYHFTPDYMAYVRVATGYRPGGGCTTCGFAALGVPGIYYSDKIINYETGLKGMFFDHRLQLDASVFYIDWSDIQLNVLSPSGLAYTGNGGTAMSTGFELTSSLQVTEKLKINATAAYTNARLTENAPGVDGLNGDQLPDSPRWTASLTADYTQPVNRDFSFMLGGGYRYRDMVLSQFVNSTAPVPLGPQNIVDLYTGLQMSRVTTRLYAKNVFNNDSYSGLLLLVGPNPSVVPVQPRTIGVSVDYQF